MFDVKRKSAIETFHIVEERLNGKVPTSLIRLGDGEGTLLGYPLFTTRCNINRILNIWFGHTNYSEHQIESLSNQLKNAVKNADIVGIPRKKQLSVHPMYKPVMTSINEFELFRQETIVTDAAIHRYFQFALLYRRILKNKDFVGLISSRDISKQLKKVFNIGKIETYFVQGEAKFPGKESTPHFPERFNAIKNELQVPYTGALFLVGAGAMGKIYCQWIKEKGGIAIDIGAIFDAWAGVKSRLIHPCHSLEVYSDFPKIYSDQAIHRFNSLCDHFDIDTQRLDKGESFEQGSFFW